MKKKLLSLLLALCLVMALVPMTAFAADTMDTWDGTADTSWYDENKTEFHLQTAEQLAGMAKLVNDNTANFKDKTVYLDNDLDLGGHDGSLSVTEPIRLGDHFRGFLTDKAM